MKKRNMVLSAALLLMLLVFTGCSSKQNEEKTVETSASVETTIQTESENNEEDTKNITGTISDIKDFMFVITDENGDAFSLSFESKPDGLDEIKDGDKVTVRYTGELSMVDAFTGEVISVKKAD